MKRLKLRWIMPASALAVAVSAGLAGSAELQMMLPADCTVVRGSVTLKVKPQQGPGERFFENPDVTLQNEMGEAVQKVEARLDPETGICSAKLDTRALPDGRYVAEVTYRFLSPAEKAETTSESVTLGVRNTPTVPARFTVKVADQVYDEDHPAEVTVRVLNKKGKPMAGARVAFVTDRGEPDTNAEITDGDGEATTSLENEDGGTTTLTVTVEGLAPVKRTVRFTAR